MTATTALPTGYATEIDGAAALVVGYLDAFPRHPHPGTIVRTFDGAHTVAEATGVIGTPLYALVSVTWATEVTTVERDGTTRTGYATGWLGTPQGTTWYLHPATYDAELGFYALDGDRRYAANGHEAAVPAEIRDAVRALGCGSDVPAAARVHNFPL
ncbi:hypothetical protein [Prescottella subtropica]|uniref:hypothetical protein n=1 Tax=Prescottella subtropica TaxID=2545757 RepID=UPI001883DDE8|nr:hypothetical protein [Prescottella subtropica]